MFPNHESAPETAPRASGKSQPCPREHTSRGAHGFILSARQRGLKTNPVGVHGNSWVSLVSKLIYSFCREWTWFLFFFFFLPVTLNVLLSQLGSARTGTQVWGLVGCFPLYCIQPHTWRRVSSEGSKPSCAVCSEIHKEGWLSVLEKMRLGWSKHYSFESISWVAC